MVETLDHLVGRVLTEKFIGELLGGADDERGDRHDAVGACGHRCPLPDGGEVWLEIRAYPSGDTLAIFGVVLILAVMALGG